MIKGFNTGQQPKDNLKQFLTVKNSTLATADLYFYGDIVSSWWGAWDDTDQYPEAIRDFLKEQEGKDLNIYINSGGGSVFAGIAIYNMLLRHKGKKTVHVDGMAASIASVIAFAANKIMMPANTFLMIHNPSGGAFGEASYLRAVADWLDKLQEMIAQTYKAHAKADVTIERIHELMAAETWLTATEAAEMFDNVELLEKDTDLDAVACLSCKKSAPEAVSALARMRREADDAAKMVDGIKKILEEAYKI